MYKNINFGKTSAQAESAQYPDLLKNGYINLSNVTDKVKYSSDFLFIGYKGAGKSAIGERLKLDLDGEYDKFVKVISLSDFPFTPFGKIIRGNQEQESKYPVAWSWVLLPYLLDSFSRDALVTHYDKVSFDATVDAFKEMGLCPSASPVKIVRTSSKATFRIKIPAELGEVGISSGELRPASEIPDYVDSLKDLISGVRSDSYHYLVIDGLDDIMITGDKQFKSIGALVFEVAKLNNLFTSNNVPAKIVVLCRTDIFERLPGANKNKIRQDHCVELDWYHDPREPEKSLLVHAANLRASLSLNRPVNIFKDLMVPTVGNVDTARYLLEFTRHTPRDFFQVLSKIQDHTDSELVSSDQIKSGIRSYSIKYFLPEIHDELTGYASPDEINTIFNTWGRLRTRDIKYNDLLNEVNSGSRKISSDRLIDIMNVLFECSAIGNIQNFRDGTTKWTFKYRNRHSSFNEKEGIMLHKGLWKALNV